MLTLDLALITYGAEGIKRVAAMDLPQITNVRYVISWQNDNGSALPDCLHRDDITISRIQSRGAAVNRNNAIAHCTADLILFSDDDLIYTEHQLQAVVNTFEDNPDVGLATFKATHPSGPVYPDNPCKLGDPLPKGYWISAYQIAFRREAIGELLCHPDFGAGSQKFTGADDELFLLSAIRRGVNCMFFPIDICTHPDLSTGTTQRLTPGNLRAIGCYLRIAYPKTYPLRIALKSYRTTRARQTSMLTALRHMISGAVGASDVLNGDRRYLW